MSYTSIFESNKEKEIKSCNEKALKLKQIFDLLYGDIFPEYLRIEFDPLDDDSIYIVFRDTWRAHFTYKNPRDYKLVF